MRIKLLFLALVASFAAQAQTIEQLTVEQFNQLSDDEKGRLEVISPISHPKNLFADEIEGVVIQFSHLDMANELDSVYLTVDSITVPLKTLNPIVIEGFGEGDHSIKFTRNDHGFSEEHPQPFTGDAKINFTLGDTRPLFENDAIVFGLLLAILGIIFWTSKLKAFKRFYGIVPALLLCYFIPSIFNSLDIVNAHVSGLYGMAKNYLLPAALVLLCLSIDLKGIYRLGPKALIMFLAIWPVTRSMK